LILLTGDLVQIGLETEIKQATAWLTALGSATQVMLVPGNHDIYAKDSADIVFQAWSDYLFQSDQTGTPELAGQFPVMRKRGNICFIGLSTACVTPVFMASGKLGGQQLEKLAVLLEQAASEDQMVCLLIHHPPLPGMAHWRKALSDADALQSVLQRHPPLLIFHGHLHHNRELYWGDSRIYCTATGSGAGDASYRVIDIEEQGDCWSFRMTLKSIAIESQGEPMFAVVDEQYWQIPKSPV
jgi:3',5'-cyclic AMP phosphodiesterase CpdA